MLKARVVYVSCMITVLIVAISIIVLQRNFNSNGHSPSNVVAVESHDTNIESLLRDERVIAFGRWITAEYGGVNLSYIIRAFDQAPNCEGAGEKLQIFNNSGTLIYEECFSGIDRIFSRNILRNARSPQLIMEVNYGGSASLLKILDYQDGRIVDLTNDIETDFSANAEVRPQFQSSVHPATEPYQILLTNPGLAGHSRKYTSVYRYRDGTYRYVGEFIQQQVDDYIEQLITQHRVR